MKTEKRPVLVFAMGQNSTQWTDSVYGKCAKHFGDNTYVAKISEGKDLNDLRRMGKIFSEGVFLCSQDFSRGIDLRLKTDAHVVIIDTDGMLQQSDAKQAAGRSSRTQGTHVATCFLKVSKIEQKVANANQIFSLRKQGDVNGIHRTIYGFIKMLTDMNSIDCRANTA